MARLSTRKTREVAVLENHVMTTSVLPGEGQMPHQRTFLHQGEDMTLTQIRVRRGKGLPLRTHRLHAGAMILTLIRVPHASVQLPRTLRLLADAKILRLPGEGTIRTRTRVRRGSAQRAEILPPLGGGTTLIPTRARPGRREARRPSTVSRPALFLDPSSPTPWRLRSVRRPSDSTNWMTRPLAELLGRYIVTSPAKKLKKGNRKRKEWVRTRMNTRTWCGARVWSKWRRGPISRNRSRRRGLNLLQGPWMTRI
mmetsp:Transcript_16557/g.25713  ORF Transcript_16557/g.25713 Transcript_16557/m.25713 type:complete len:254 (+) Transcript_16557:447-1208(+)